MSGTENVYIDMISKDEKYISILIDVPHKCVRRFIAAYAKTTLSQLNKLLNDQDKVVRIIVKNRIDRLIQK